MASNIGDTESTVTPTFVNESFIVAHPSTVGDTKILLEKMTQYIIVIWFLGLFGRVYHCSI